MIAQKQIPAHSELEIAVLRAVGVREVVEDRRILATADKTSAMFRERSECGQFTARQVIAACRQERAAIDPADKFTAKNPDSKIAWAIAGAECRAEVEREIQQAKRDALEIVTLGGGLLMLDPKLKPRQQDYLTQKAGL